MPDYEQCKMPYMPDVYKRSIKHYFSTTYKPLRGFLIRVSDTVNCLAAAHISTSQCVQLKPPTNQLL